MIKNRLKGLLISSTVLLAFIGAATLNSEKVAATPNDVVISKTDKKMNEETLSILLKDIKLTQEKVKELLENQEKSIQEKEKISNDISDIKVRLTDKQKGIDNLKTSTEKLAKELAKVEKDLFDTSSDLKKSEETLKNLNDEITERKKIMSNRLRAVQVNGKSQPDIVDIIFASESLESALNNIINISTLKSAENDMLVSIEKLESEQEKVTNSILNMEKEIKRNKNDLDNRYKDLHKKQETLVKEKEELLKQEKSFENLLKDSEKEITGNSENLKVQQETIDALQTKIEEVVSNLDVIKDNERIAELNRLQSQLSAYSSNTINYSSDFLISNTEAQQKLIKESENYLGIPYVWGGTTPSGFDCSGFTQYVYKHALGISLPRVTTQQDKMGIEVPLSDIQVGDLIFWGEPTYHVAIYAGNGYYIHAPSTGDVVKYANRPLTGASHIRRIL